MIDINKDIKEKFVEMCSMIFVNSNGKFTFPIDNIRYDKDWEDFISHKDWSTLENKMNNLIKLINKDKSIIELDVEEQIWEMI
jgi:hypothetical protein